MSTQPIAVHEPTALTDAVKVLIAFERPSSTTLKHLNRGDKFQTLVKRCGEQRANLLDWAAKHQLQEEIIRVGKPTAFNMIFVEASPRAADQLLNAPNVKRIVQVQDFALEAA